MVQTNTYSLAFSIILTSILHIQFLEMLFPFPLFHVSCQLKNQHFPNRKTEKGCSKVLRGLKFLKLEQVLSRLLDTAK